MFDSDLRKQQQHEYIYLGGSLVATREKDTATGAYSNRYQHTDALGSPVVVTSQGRGVLERTEYEPFGQVLNRPLKDGPGYTGHVEDATTGLVQMQQRYYDPMLGRFLSVDPVTANPKTGSNFNRYWYANNNPYANKDPDGRLCAPVISSSEMCDRSLRYAAMDQDSSINSQTRFFAAASIVTNALGTLAVAQTPFMTGLSRGLEQHNLKTAAAIRSGAFLPGATPSQRDAAFVHSEQTLVQGRLDQLKADSPNAYSAHITGVNSLLNSRTFGQSSDPNFGRAIRIATKAVGGPLDFANQSHREALGRAAIGVARSQAQYCTGSRIRRC
ncbi:RHS repeat-associated core domain-containing protein [Lysobacter sp. A286]